MAGSAPGLLDEVIQRYKSASEEQQENIREAAKSATQGMIWVPNPGPQTQAYLSEADELLYGGQAGGGKSHLVVGVGVNNHQRGIIFRRELTQTDGLEEEGRKMIGTMAQFNGTDHEWTWPDGKTLKLGAMRQANSWRDHAGRERDYMAFDEAAEFLEEQVSSIQAWLRAESGRRTRTIYASNPPRTAEGLWIIEWFAPWLDEHYPDPAEPGELRWCVMVNGKTVWVEDRKPKTIDGETYLPISRTFIPASLEDNPYRNNPEYRAKLMALQEPLRSQLLYGKFSAGLDDVENQVIPTAWVRAAMDRWQPNHPMDIPMCAIGVDAAAGGQGQLVLQPRYDAYFAEQVKIPGKDIPDDKPGAYAAGQIVGIRADRAVVVVDMGGGYGGPMYERLNDNKIECVAYKGAEATTLRTRDKQLGFFNVRSAAYWAVRELLDPDQPGGSPAQLPPDRRILAGLCAPTYTITPRGIKVEPKVDVVDRLGWSPDEADGVVMAWWAGDKASNAALEWQRLRLQASRNTGQQRTAVMGRAASIRRRRG